MALHSPPSLLHSLIFYLSLSSFPLKLFRLSLAHNYYNVLLSFSVYFVSYSFPFPHFYILLFSYVSIFTPPFSTSLPLTTLSLTAYDSSYIRYDMRRMARWSKSENLVSILSLKVCSKRVNILYMISFFLHLLVHASHSLVTLTLHHAVCTNKITDCVEFDNPHESLRW